LEEEVDKTFTFDDLLFVDPDKRYIANTRHFEDFLRQHEIKEVTHNTVISYLKSVESLSFNERTRSQLISLENDFKKQNKRLDSLNFILITGLTLVVLAHMR